MMWGPIALAAIVCLTAAGAIAEIEDAWTRYDIRVTLDPAEQTLVGSQQVNYINDTDTAVDEILFSLIGNWGAEPNPYLHPAVLDSQYVRGFDPTWTRIHDVTNVSGQPLPHHFEPFPPAQQTYSLKAGLLVIDLPASLGPGERVTVNIEFETRFSHAMALDNCVYRETYVWRFGWNPIAVSAAARDGGFAIPAADYHAVLTVPEEYRLFGGADRQDELETVAGLTSYELTNSHPVRSVPLILGTELDSVSSAWNGVELEAVYLPGGETFARLSLSYLAEILAYHSDTFGPLGYGRLVLAEAPSPGFFGMAADGMILAGRSFSQLKDMPALGVYDRLLEYLLAHEAAHLWWGIGIGTDFDAENWISEGFAEYLSITYFEEKYGALEPNLLSHLGSGLLEDVIRGEFGYLNLRQHLSESPYLELLRMDFDEAIVKPMVDVDYLNGQSIRVYNKGYLVLRTLESLIGRDALRTALVEANASWRGEVLTVDVFRSLAEDASGVDLERFFDDWLYGDARHDVAIDGFESVEFGDGFTTTIRLRRDGPELPVPVRATLDDGTVVDAVWEPDCCAADALILETSAPVRSVHLDPDEMLLDANRFNNHSPRRILVGHPFRDDDAPEIGRPLDAYVISLSPTGVSGSFRTDHRWSITAMPHVDPNASYGDFLDAFETWDVIGVLAANIDRSLSLSATASVIDLDPAEGTGELDARLTLHVLGFSNPEIGSAGTYWYPVNQFALTVGALGELPRPIPYLMAQFGRSDLLSLYMINTVTVRAGIPGFGAEPFATAEWSGMKRIRLAHLFYLDLSVSAGTSLIETVPTDFMFSLNRLRAFELPPFGNRQLYGRLALSFPPLARNLGYPIFNLTRVEDVIASAFIQGGRTWGGCDLVCESGIRVEAGAELTILVDGVLGGGLAMSLGYAYPLSGLDGEESVYFDFALPF